MLPAPVIAGLAVSQRTTSDALGAEPGLRAHVLSRPKPLSRHISQGVECPCHNHTTSQACPESFAS